MVPDEYHDFFLGTVTVAGALIGLLFVAISVHPGKLAEDGWIGMRVRVTAALLAFLDALFVSLVALRPDTGIGKSAFGIGIAGAVAMITLLVAVLTRSKGMRRRELAGTLVLIAGQGCAYVYQLIGGLQLANGGPAGEGISLQSTLILVFFGFGVFRAWEYVGGPRTGILGAVDELRHHPPVQKPASTAETTHPTENAQEG
jgi:hypothetical protein